MMTVVATPIPASHDCRRNRGLPPDAPWPRAPFSALRAWRLRRRNLARLNRQACSIVRTVFGLYRVHAFLQHGELPGELVNVRRLAHVSNICPTAARGQARRRHARNLRARHLRSARRRRSRSGSTRRGPRSMPKLRTNANPARYSRFDTCNRPRHRHDGGRPPMPDVAGL